MPNLTKSIALLGAAALVVSVSACQKYESKPGGNEAAAPAANTGAVTDAIKADEKKWKRIWKLSEIEQMNPDWSDLYPTLS